MARVLRSVATIAADARVPILAAANGPRAHVRRSAAIAVARAPTRANVLRGATTIAVAREHVPRVATTIAVAREHVPRAATTIAVAREHVPRAATTIAVARVPAEHALPSAAVRAPTPASALRVVTTIAALAHVLRVVTTIAARALRPAAIAVGRLPAAMTAVETAPVLRVARAAAKGAARMRIRMARSFSCGRGVRGPIPTRSRTG